MNRYDSVNSDEKSERRSEEKSNLKGDYRNVGILLLLYGLQGVPQGIGLAMPILLQNRGVSYTDQAKFSFSFFPYSIKLLWAPIIDSIYIRFFGRRKTWICSSQVLIGICMIFLSYHIDTWLSSDPNILNLTAIFGILWFLTSTQDIAVDGWSLTLLQRKNIGYAATCNLVGQPVGKFIGHILLLVLESKEFCNEYIFSEPHDTGLFTLSSFLLFWGFLYLAITFLVAIFKHERDEFSMEQLEDHPDYGIKRAYPILLKLLKSKPVILLSAMIFTTEGAFAAWENITSLKLIDYGVPKDKIAFFSIPSAPVQIFLPLFITRFTNGPKPLSFYYKLFPCRLMSMAMTAIFVYFTPKIIFGGIPGYFYGILVIILMLEQAFLRSMIAAECSFDAKICDPLIGGTYITLLNTCSNFGRRVFVTFLLWLLDKVTWKKCDFKTFANNSISISFNCTLIDDVKHCPEKSCDTIIDGYYIEIIISFIYGLIWLKIFKSIIAQLQSYPREAWYILTKNQNKIEELVDMKII